MCMRSVPLGVVKMMCTHARVHAHTHTMNTVCECEMVYDNKGINSGVH